jgi:imidazolonepropionase-like amidohydrolase
MSGCVIANVRILDSTGRQPFPGAVRVEGNRIAEVVPGPAGPPAGGACVIDALEAARDHVFVAPALGITYTLSQAAGQWGITAERARGFSAMDTLVAATRLGGEIMGRPGELGVIRPGALADLLVVDGDPLADIGILQDPGALRLILKDGALHKRPAPRGPDG